MSENTTPPPPPKKAPKPPESWVYFIRAGDHIKIGWARDPKKRIDKFRTGCPFAIELIGVVRGGEDDERAIHDAFRPLRARGEWFRAEPHLLALVAWLCHMDRRWEECYEDAKAAGDELVESAVVLTSHALFKAFRGEFEAADSAWQSVKTCLPSWRRGRE